MHDPLLRTHTSLKLKVRKDRRIYHSTYRKTAYFPKYVSFGASASITVSFQHSKRGKRANILPSTCNLIVVSSTCILYQKRVPTFDKDIKYNPGMSQSNGSVNKERKDSGSSIKSKIETYENGSVTTGRPSFSQSSKSASERNSVSSGKE